MSTDRIALPTENYEPYYRSLQEFSATVEENSRIIGRIARVIDVDLAYPSSNVLTLETGSNGLVLEKNGNDDQTGGTENFNGRETSENGHELAESNTLKSPFESLSETQQDDYLRDYLDNVLDIKGISLDADFPLEGIANEKVRLLLEDNYRLTVLKRMKLQKNQALLKMLRDYEVLLSQVIMPRLSKEVSEQNTKTLQNINKIALPESLAQRNLVWLKYLQYTEQLEKIRGFAESMEAVSLELLEPPRIDRLGAELGIVGNVLAYTNKRERGESPFIV
ncbi:hypothetical protein PUMCH_005097 [Australozyma saopauloensis]|uniref:Uncharacterized protein n=1 Tax=Australozyma saopauloensis TaxID=291208 RepID=A0AAX4HGH1_9ASCO|nr:hypothetical protein PUMCH_005097 [[Candida] saopauloensis]